MRRSTSHEVGYRKPPKSGQFRKGQSGNPRGRPQKRLESYTGIIQKVFATKIPVNKSGRTQYQPIGIILGNMLIARAKNGGVKSTMLMHRYFKFRFSEKLQKPIHVIIRKFH
jgi:hypothetical protein